MSKKSIAAALIVFVCIIAGILFFVLPQKNDDGRIDIYNSGNKDNNITYTEMSSSVSPGGEFNNPEWLGEPGNGKVFKFSPSYFWKTGEINFSANGNGKVRIDILGAYRQLDNVSGEIEKVFVEYKDVVVNGVSIIKEPKLLWHDDRKIYFFPSTDKEVYTITFKYKKPLFKRG